MLAAWEESHFPRIAACKDPDTHLCRKHRIDITGIDLDTDSAGNRIPTQPLRALVCLTRKVMTTDTTALQTPLLLPKPCAPCARAGHVMALRTQTIGIRPCLMRPTLHPEKASPSKNSSPHWLEGWRTLGYNTSRRAIAGTPSSVGVGISPFTAVAIASCARNM